MTIQEYQKVRPLQRFYEIVTCFLFRNQFKFACDLIYVIGNGVIKIHKASSIIDFLSWVSKHEPHQEEENRSFLNFFVRRSEYSCSIRGTKENEKSQDLFSSLRCLFTSYRYRKLNPHHRETTKLFIIKKFFNSCIIDSAKINSLMHFKGIICAEEKPQIIYQLVTIPKGASYLEIL